MRSFRYRSYHNRQCAAHDAYVLGDGAQCSTSVQPYPTLRIEHRAAGRILHRDADQHEQRHGGQQAKGSQKNVKSSPPAFLCGLS
jgi:hypothetical protein